MNKKREAKAKAVQRARALRGSQPDAEATLWRCLRGRGLEGYKFRRQHPVGKYIVDLVCLDKRLIIELDGSQHLGQQAYDAERTEWLESEGYRVLRFWDNEVFANLDGVGQAILLALQETHPHPKGLSQNN